MFLSKIKKLFNFCLIIDSFMNSFKEKGKYFNVKSECGVFSALGKLDPHYTIPNIIASTDMNGKTNNDVLTEDTILPALNILYPLLFLKYFE